MAKFPELSTGPALSEWSTPGLVSTLETLVGPCLQKPGWESLSLSEMRWEDPEDQRSIQNLEKYISKKYWQGKYFKKIRYPKVMRQTSDDAG